MTLERHQSRKEKGDQLEAQLVPTVTLETRSKRNLRMKILGKKSGTPLASGEPLVEYELHLGANL